MSQSNFNPLNFSLGNAEDPEINQNTQDNFFSENIQIKNEIKNLESCLNLHGLPQFFDILTHLHQGNHLHLYRTAVSNLLTIIQLKEKDNQIRVEYVNKLTKLEQEKQNLEVLVGKLKSNLNELTEKIKKFDQVIVDKKKKWKEKKQKFLSDIDQEQKLYQRVRVKEAQLQNDIKKKDNLINKQNEQIKKMIGLDKTGSNSVTKDFSFLSSAPKNEISLSYGLAKNSTYFGGITNNISNTITSGSQLNAITYTGKTFFNEEIQKYFDNKYTNIIKENESVKSFLYDVHFKLLTLVELKKEVFLENYKRTFGEDYKDENENKMSIIEEENNNIVSGKSSVSQSQSKNYLSFLKEKVSFNNSLEKNLDVDSFVSIFNSNYSKLKEYLIRNEELNYINNFMDGQSAGSTSKFKDTGSYLTDKYVQNMASLLENYKTISNHQTSLLNQCLRLNQSKQQSSFADLVSRLDTIDLNGFNTLHNLTNQNVKRIKESINENNLLLHKYSIDNAQVINQVNQEINQMKENEKINIENAIRFNNNLREEIDGYESLIATAVEFCRKTD